MPIAYGIVLDVMHVVVALSLLFFIKRAKNKEIATRTLEGKTKDTLFMPFNKLTDQLENIK